MDNGTRKGSGVHSKSNRNPHSYQLRFDLALHRIKIPTLKQLKQEKVKRYPWIRWQWAGNSGMDNCAHYTSFFCSSGVRESDISLDTRPPRRALMSSRPARMAPSQAAPLLILTPDQGGATHKTTLCALPGEKQGKRNFFFAHPMTDPCSQAMANRA